MIEDVLVKVDKFIFLADFIVLDMEEDKEIPIILGRPFLATGRAMIDVQRGELKLRVQEDEVKFNVFEVVRHPAESDTCFIVETVEAIVSSQSGLTNPLEASLVQSDSEILGEEAEEYVKWMDSFEPNRRKYFESLGENTKTPMPFVEQPPKMEQKPLPSHLKYAYLGNASTLPVIISASLTAIEEDKLLRVLRDHKNALGWSLADLKGIRPSMCMHRILLEDGQPSVEAQRRLNPTMKEVVCKEVLKWLDTGVIYPISDNAWVSPVQVVPKKGGTTVIRTENNTLLPSRTVTDWRICIDYRKLNKATRRDHFPLPFLDQMLDRLAGHEYYCFLDGYSGYNKIAIAPEDKEKTTFTCPYGTYAFKQMPFGLCNAPVTFQHCMMAILSDMVEKTIEVFMDDYSVLGNSFDNYVNYLVAKVIPLEFSYKQKERFFAHLKHYYWEEPILYRHYVDQLIRRCVPKDEMVNIMNHCHTLPCGGHFGDQRIAAKVLQSGFYWPSLFKDAHQFVSTCNKCQRMGSFSIKDEPPMNTIMEVELFDLWGMDFMGPFPPFLNNLYILLAVDYVSKWVEAIPTRTNDASVVAQFLCSHIFTRFGTPRALITNRGIHFCNKMVDKVLHEYEVRHRTSLAYHP